MRGDFESSVLQNPALGALLLWQVARAFTDRHPDGAAPQLPFFLLALPMLFHAPTVRRIKAMNFDSGLMKAVSDGPEIALGLQDRLKRSAGISLQALELACASHLLVREYGSGFPSFRAEGTALPPGARSVAQDVRDMMSAARRLGVWFADDGIQGACLRLDVRF